MQYLIPIVVDSQVSENYNINVSQSFTVNLPCHLEMNTKPIWFKNHTELLLQVNVMYIIEMHEISNLFTLFPQDSQNTFVQNDGTLILVDVTADSSGEYYCQVNMSGEVRNGLHYLLQVIQPEKNTVGECYCRNLSLNV